MANWLSPVQILDTKVLGVSLSIDEDFEGGETLFSLTMNSNLVEPKFSDGTWSCKCVLEAVGNWVRGDEEDQQPAFSASCKLGIAIGITDEAIEPVPEDERRDFIAANAISIAYGKIRAVIENITSESLVGRQTIPAIDPYSLIESMNTPKEK